MKNIIHIILIIWITAFLAIDSAKYVQMWREQFLWEQLLKARATNAPQESNAPAKKVRTIPVKPAVAVPTPLHKLT